MADSLQIVTSSLIRSYSYDTTKYILTVVFVNDDSTEHQYFNVMPSELSAVFDSGGSIGSKFVKRIARTHKHSVKQQEDKSDL